MKVKMEQTLFFDLSVNAEGLPQCGFFAGDIRLCRVQLLEPDAFGVESILCPEGDVADFEEAVAFLRLAGIEAEEARRALLLLQDLKLEVRGRFKAYVFFHGNIFIVRNQWGETIRETEAPDSALATAIGYALKGLWWHCELRPGCKKEFPANRRINAEDWKGKIIFKI